MHFFSFICCVTSSHPLELRVQLFWKKSKSDNDRKTSHNKAESSVGGMKRKLVFPLLTRWFFFCFLYLNIAPSGSEKSTNSQNPHVKLTCCAVVCSESYFHKMWSLIAWVKHQHNTILHPVSQSGALPSSRISCFIKSKKKRKKDNLHKSRALVYVDSHVHKHRTSLCS